MKHFDALSATQKSQAIYCFGLFFLFFLFGDVKVSRHVISLMSSAIPYLQDAKLGTRGSYWVEHLLQRGAGLRDGTPPLTLGRGRGNCK